MPEPTPPTGRWPGGARCAVVVSVDFDAELPLLAASPEMARRAKTLSVGRYGATRGVDRLLREFADLNVRTTWCVPGRQAEIRPDLVRRIAEAGHEIANHGHGHEDFDHLDLPAQRALVERASAALAEVTGVPPKGFRVPTGEWDPGLPGVLAGLGFTWTSSLHGDDLPYFHPAAAGGRLVEIPVHHELADHPYFFFNLDPAFPAGQSRIASYQQVLGNWTTEFDAYRRFGLAYVLRLQPEVTGTPGRIRLVRELLEHVRGHDDVWLATAGEVADWWTGTQPDNRPDHPAEVFARHAGSAGGTR
ncbi:polysaccharide deacetylase [Streptomyces sp. RKCA744]|uniref:polysaccharide deacetylase family protein n=1 Tax=Streptomyces sp. RKCA744 TaxID=2959340 RepID=UPI0020A011E0|nr:polysaccharide deacetylase [Streptomyces sp. RKCA744]MCO8307166.1 polysaccharide deacetylase [Streptomyces sp. RKCA744]